MRGYTQRVWKKKSNLTRVEELTLPAEFTSEEKVKPPTWVTLAAL